MLGQRGKEEGGMKSPKAEEVEELVRKGSLGASPQGFAWRHNSLTKAVRLGP